MKDKISLNKLFKYNAVFSSAYTLARHFHLFLINKRFSDEKYLKRMFKKYHGYELNLENPQTLNEKLQLIKLKNRQDWQNKFADKFDVRTYIQNTFGEKYLIPLVFHTVNYRELRPENLPDYPVAIKTNHGFGNTIIVRDKSIVDWQKLRMDYRRWLHNDYYYYEREWQYKGIEPRIIVEKLLLDKEGRLPNDYKLNFIEGKLEFIYVSVDREFKNKRNIYDPEWNPLYFTWARKGKDLTQLRGDEISPPPTLSKMIQFGSEIARMFKYVRVDFYDVDGILFFGEITQCHGGGFDQMLPFEYDIKYGEKLKLDPY